MKVYCNNGGCRHCKKLTEDFYFKFHKNYQPLGEDDKVYGICRAVPSPAIVADGVCAQGGADRDFYSCEAMDCLWNNGGECERDETLVNKLLTNNCWCCRCYSQKKISGHMNWMNLLNSDGSAKGGHIDDADAERMDKANRSFKILPDGTHRDSRPRKYRGREI